MDKESTPERLLVTADEAAEMLAVSKRTVWRLVAEGELPSVTVSRRLRRFRPEDLRAWTEAQVEGVLFIEEVA